MYDHKPQGIAGPEISLESLYFNLPFQVYPGRHTPGFFAPCKPQEAEIEMSLEAVLLLLTAHRAGI